MPQLSGPASAPFFTMIPRRSVIIFFVAVFLIFAPIGLLMGSSFVEERPLYTLLIAAAISGLIAVSWAATFTISRRWAVGIVLFSAMQMAFFGPLENTWFGIGTASVSIEGYAIVLAIVLGYALFIIFISGQGRTTLRLHTEMELARRIHETLVPRLEVNEAHFEVLGVSHASSEMGGDLVDAVRHGQSTDVIMADVSGHGVRAGVVMGMVKSAVRTSLLAPPPLDRMLGSLNDVLEQTTAPEMYSTFAVLRIGAAGAPIEYALAGHHHIDHYRASDGALRRLQQAQLPLGMLPRRTFESGSVEVASGDLLALYTDGLNETENAAGEQLGHDPIGRILVDRAGAALSGIQSELFDLVRRHGDAADDQTVLLVRIK